MKCFCCCVGVTLALQSPPVEVLEEPGVPRPSAALMRPCQLQTQLSSWPPPPPFTAQNCTSFSPLRVSDRISCLKATIYLHIIRLISGS